MKHHQLILPGIQLVTGLVFTAPINASTVTTCDEVSLRTAITQGGTVDFACDGTITLTNTIEIRNSVAIDGTGRQIVISGGGQVRLFQVNTGVVFSARHLAFSDGRNQGTNAPSSSTVPGGEGKGAGFLILGGSLNLVDCAMSNHVVQGGTGTAGFAAGGQARGGAICAFEGQVNLTNCVLFNNQSKGGLAYPSVPMAVLPAGDALGGAIYAEGGRVTAYQTDFRSNKTIGGDIWFGLGPSGREGPTGEAQGGALYATSAVAVVNISTFQSNSASGGLNGWSGPGEGHARGGALSLVDGTCQVSQSLFLANSVIGGGGGRLSSGGESSGGAIHNVGNLQIVDSGFSENSALGGGAATPLRGLGGAISSFANLAMNRCLLDHNKATGGSGVQVGPFGASAGNNGCGGAIYAINYLALTNVTSFGNQAIGGKGGINLGTQGASGAGQGGGVCVAGGTASLTHVTIAHNSAYGGVTGPIGTTNIGPAQGGGVETLAGSVVFLNSILSSNLTGSNCFGVVIDGGHNISSDGSCLFTGAGSLNDTDPVLSPLADFGGPTLTMSPLPGSPAIDAADTASSPATDQRGVPRPQRERADIGAVEDTFLQIVRLGGGEMRLRYVGVPSESYTLEATTQFGELWSPIETKQANQNGAIQYSDLPGSAPHHFFRVKSP